MRDVAPLADALRPRSFDEIIGQDHLVGPGAPLRVMAESGRISSLILWGPAGTGKTTIARILSESAGFSMETLSAVSAGVKDIRDVISRAVSRLGERGTRTILFIDEVHRFNKSQQDLLLPATESGQIILIGATTENPFFEVNAALMSRTTLWRVHPLDHQGLSHLIDRALTLRNVEMSEEARNYVAATSDGDGRAALTTLDVAIALTSLQEDSVTVELEHVTQARDGRIHHQSSDSHYDQVSAYIKSIRGSDPDAAIFWLTVLLQSGERPRFIARRLVILASEDIGLADPTSLLIAEASARTVEFVGLPECRLTLAQATLHLALAPKSNSVLRALSSVDAALAAGVNVTVPSTLRDAHYASSTRIGHGVGYLYPHDHPRHWVEQQYLPYGISEVFYQPSTEGREPVAWQRWMERRANDVETGGPPVE
ncbi:MAG: replication-associated recombination protein A [Actinomycetota bacterium]